MYCIACYVVGQWGGEDFEWIFRVRLCKVNEVAIFSMKGDS